MNDPPGIDLLLNLALTLAMMTILLYRAAPELLSLTAVADGAVRLLVIRLSTAFWQVPQHERLPRRFDSVAWRKLVRSNCLRTGAWKARFVLLLGVVGRTLS